MNLNNIITGSPVTSEELRAARDRRVLKKWELLTPGGEICLVEFSLNIAGAVKTFPFARAAFRFIFTLRFFIFFTSFATFQLA